MFFLGFKEIMRSFVGYINKEDNSNRINIFLMVWVFFLDIFYKLFFSKYVFNG